MTQDRWSTLDTRQQFGEGFPVVGYTPVVLSSGSPLCVLSDSFPLMSPSV